jgi:NAD(P)-dependent dehydrogenase (short-subunit alcohol dehydrogenase family)
MNDLAGRVAVVTGASRGLGQRAAVRLAQRGAAVALVARGQSGLRETAALIAQAGGRSAIVAADLGSPASLDTVKRGVEDALGAPSILVNAAGVFGPIAPIRDGDPQAWIETMMINMVSAYLTCRAFVGGMIDAGWGRIINVSSAATLHTPGPVNSAYATSKVALNQFTRHLAAEVAGTGVTANVIHPGDVKTEMWAYIRSAAARLGPAGDVFTQWADWVEQTGGDDPEKAADLILDLVADTAAQVNGRFLWIAGGLQAPIASWGDDDQQPWRP